jgi:hypothetical protein
MIPVASAPRISIERSISSRRTAPTRARSPPAAKSVEPMRATGKAAEAAVRAAIG